MYYSFRSYGLGNIQVDESLTDLSGNLPSWKKLIMLRPSVKSGEYKIYFLNNHLIDASGISILPGFIWDSIMGEGTYGRVYYAHRALYIHQEMTTPDFSDSITYKCSLPFHKIVVKEIAPDAEESEGLYEKSLNTILYEAAIHCLVAQCLAKAGLQNVVPKIYEVFGRGNIRLDKPSDIESICISMEYVQGKTLLSYLNSVLTKCDKYAVNGLPISNVPNEIYYTRRMNERLIFEIIAQVAIILRLLQSKLRFNHRDMKVNNVLVRDNVDEGSSRIWQNEYTSIKWLQTCNVVLIDYGFACIACGEGHDPPEESLVEAGAWFGPAHVCFKKGRDLCQFLYCLYTYFPFYNYVSPQAYMLFKKWLSVQYNEGEAKLVNGVHSDGRPHSSFTQKPMFNTGIYEFLRRPEVDPENATPEIILQDIHNFYKT